jgi:formamidopyrimidine-DNA glycosylase
MPELPEVEVTKRGLEKLLKSKSQVFIQSIEFGRKDLRFPIPIARLKKLQGAEVLKLHRRAKYLLIETSQGVLISHFGMTGTWQSRQDFEPAAHDHVRLKFSGGISIIYRDPRRFGYIVYLPKLEDLRANKHFKHLGPEPLSADFDADYLWKALRKKSQKIKVAIMDQRLVVGVGNIYASEALFMSQINPLVLADKLSLEKCGRLVRAIKIVLKSAIERGGSSISDFAGVSGETGYFQSSHQVYDRKGQPCVVCAQQIRSKVLTGRNTFWCPCCQK